MCKREWQSPLQILEGTETKIPPSYGLGLGLLKFIYSKKAIKFCEISIEDLTVTTYIVQIYGGDFANICDLLRIYDPPDFQTFLRPWTGVASGHHTSLVLPCCELYIHQTKMLFMCVAALNCFESQFPSC